MLVGLAVLSLLAQSDPTDWAPLPETAKPPPATVEPAPVEPPTDAPVAQPEVQKPEAFVPPPDPRRFTWGHITVSLMGALGSSGYFAVRIEAGAVYGWPRRIEGSPDHAMGPTIGLALDLAAAKVRVSTCGTAGVCGSRYEAGLALRGAWNWGVIGSDGVVAPIHAIFLQAVGYLSSNSVPSAPLAPGDTWGEHGVRFDLGLTSGFLRGSTWPKPGAFALGGGLYVALSLEWIIAHSTLQRALELSLGQFRAGLSLGVGI